MALFFFLLLACLRTFKCTFSQLIIVLRFSLKIGFDIYTYMWMYAYRSRAGKKKEQSLRALGKSECKWFGIENSGKTIIIVNKPVESSLNHIVNLVLRCLWHNTRNIYTTMTLAWCWFISWSFMNIYCWFLSIILQWIIKHRNILSFTHVFTMLRLIVCVILSRASNTQEEML